MSIVEVAKEAGVSKSTVSRVINDVPGVTPSACDAVRKAMDKLGYQPSSRRPGPKPASRRGIRTGNVLLLALGFEPHEVYRMPVFPSLLHGVETALREAGLNLVLAGYHPDQPLPPALGTHQADGVLVMGRTETLDDALREKLGKIPVVGLMRGFDAVDNVFDRALYDNAAVGPLAARYLLDHGHKHVASLNLNPDHPAFARRLADFKQQMEQGGAGVLELVGQPSEGDLRDPMRRLVQQLAEAKPKITALCAASDVLLPTLYPLLRDAGIEPGEGLRIISCDNEKQFIEQVHPRPATIDIRVELVGQQAVRQLIWRLAHPDEPSRVTVLVEPVLIESE